MSKVLLLLLLAVPASLRAQDTATVLTGMAALAGVIFAGQVQSIARHDAEGFVDIQFRVDTAVRGCAPGTYTVREWAGRWVGHPVPYRVGQQLLMLLTSPSAAGISAPVYGQDGALPVVAGAAGTLGDVGPAAEPVVDLRLLAARAAPPAQTPTHDNFILVGPIATDGSAAVWPSLSNILNLLRGGSVGH